MIKQIVVILAILAASAYAGRDLVVIDIFNRADLVRLDQLGVIINAVRGLEVEAEVTAGQAERLRAEGYGMMILTRDIDEVYRRNFEEGRGRYLTYSELTDTMRIIAQNNPTICKLDTLMTTATGYLVLAMKLSDNPQLNEAEPRVMFEADIHGDEKCGWAVAWEMLKYLVLNYGSNTLVTRLIDTREIWIIPTINPYGYVNGIRANSNGVDLNRNWGYMWRNTSGSATFSEQETRAARKAFDRDAFAIWMSYHGGTVISLYPWGFHTDLPLDSAELATVCASYAVATNNDYGRIIDVMYYAPGNSIDHLYGAEGTVGIAAEISYTKTPPASSIDALFNTNRDPMLNLMRYAKWGIEGQVTDSATGLPLCRALIEPISPARWVSYSDSPGGDYHRYLRPGTYSVRYSANLYASKTVSVTVPADTSVVVNVELARAVGQNCGAVKCAVCNVTDPSQAYANHSLSFWALGLRDSRRLSIGVRGWVDLDLGKPFANVSGNDLIVVEGDADAEVCTVFVADTPYGPWTRLGTANGTTSFDLQAVGLSQGRFVRLKDDGDGSASSATAGYDVDAVESIALIGTDETVPDRIAAGVLSASPNPFHHATRISVGIRAEGLGLRIYDKTGRLINTMALNLSLNPNSQSLMWNGTDQTGQSVPKGVYFAHLPGAQPVKIVKVD